MSLHGIYVNLIVILCMAQVYNVGLRLTIIASQMNELESGALSDYSLVRGTASTTDIPEHGNVFVHLRCHN